MKLLYIFVFYISFWVSETANGVAGDTYSCFSNFESVSTDGCSGVVNGEGSSYEQQSIAKIKGMDFCVSGPSYGKAKQGSFGKSKNYVVTADLKSSFIEKYTNRYGFLGLAFNMIDSKNYEIVYIRPHTAAHCWELGHVEDGLLFSRDFGECASKINTKTFNLAVKLENGKGSVYLNGVEMTTFTPFYPSVNKVATALRNNMVAKLKALSFEICQEIDCVSRNKAGETVVTKPGQSYQDQGMSKCEACSCQLYGQIKCGCRSASEQGVHCTGGKIAAVGHDCCARCVPASASCSASGDPHYRTFDGRSFDFMGSCTYCLVKTNDFEIRQKNRYGGSVSYNEYCQILFDGDQFEMRGGLSFTEKGKAERGVATPFKKYYATEDYVYCTSGSQCAIYIKGIQMLTIRCSSGSYSLSIHGTYYEKTQCLCGTWDGNPGNDFHDKDGNVVGSANAMGTSWQVANDDGCPNPPDPIDPCDEVSRDERNWAEQYCARYKQEPFKSCPVDVTQYFESCKFDVCTDPTNDDNVCDNAAAYAEACRVAGHPVMGWRSKSFCPMDCDDTFVYDNCGSGCHPTCEDPDPSDCKETCVEGCYCPTGTVLQGGKCIDSSDCKCMHEGSFLDNGAKWNDTVQCKTCECKDGGIVECSPLKCNSCPKGSVPITKSGVCCPYCIADWAQEKEEKIELTEGEGPAVMECVLHDDVLVAPDAITWKYANGEEINADNMPDNFVFDKSNLKLTINPAHLTDDNEYIAEVVYNGVVGQCKFDLTVNPIPPISYIDLDGESPRVVKEGDCQTMSVKVLGDFKFGKDEFKWTFGPTDKPIDFSSDKYTLLDGGKTLKVCDAEDSDEGKYEVCVEKDGVRDCVEIELRVLAVCSDSENVEYVEGDEWKEGSYKQCKCTVSGEIECTCIEQDIDCAEGEEKYYDEDCQALCSRDPATCTVTGDPHYKSFDGYRHDFQGGSCRFTLVETSDFQVIGTNNHRDGNDDVSWNDAVDIKFKNLGVFLGAEGKVEVNGQTVFLPYRKVWRDKKSVSITKAGDSVIVEIGLGNDLQALSLVWDGNSTVDATVHGKYFEKTKGLCGKWDEDDKNDQTSKAGDIEGDLASFGWSWKYVEGDEVCKEEPTPPHPCDDALFPDAEPIADAACDILEDAPFNACHEVVDKESALHNCKYDTCSCFDETCACHAIKKYVQECGNAGVANITNWRLHADFCPMDCDSPLTYDSCGSYCPPTCADKTPDCGKKEGKCNEGCFCPKGTYLQDGECVEAVDCRCEQNGTFYEVGQTWANKDACEFCRCMAEGELDCERESCKKCTKKEQSIYENEDSCCPTCREDWLWAEPAVFEDVAQFTDLKISCQSLVKPYKTEWFYSESADGPWENLNSKSGLNLYFKSITDASNGYYKCEARKNFRRKSAVISVKCAAKAEGCTSVNPENGIALPLGHVDIGGKVVYECDDDSYISDNKVSECGDDGSISNIPTCIKVETVEFVAADVHVKKGKATVNCGTTDKSFNAKATISFQFVDENGALLSAINQKPAFRKKNGSNTYYLTFKEVKTTTHVQCSGKSGDGKKFASGFATINV